MSIHVVLRQQNDFDGRDSWCESTLTIRGTELEKEQNAGWWRRMLWRLFSGLVLHCDSNRLKLAENWIRPNWFHEFFLESFSKFIKLPFPVTAFASHFNLSNRCRLVNSNFWRIFDVWPNFVSEAVFLASARIGSSWRMAICISAFSLNGDNKSTIPLRLKNEWKISGSPTMIKDLGCHVVRNKQINWWLLCH